MGKTFLGIVLLALLLAVPMASEAEVFVDINIGLPPLIEFAEPPELVVLPGTYVYIAPDVDQDIYFYGGWWWRPWEGHWYRSRHYDSGWARYRSVPQFYRGIPSGWRDDYREHQWQGHRWDYQRLPQHQVNRNWKSWERNKHWEKKQGWGVEGYRAPRRTQPAQRAVQPRQSRPQRQEAQPARMQQPDNQEKAQVQQRPPRAQQPAPKVQSRPSQPQSKLNQAKHPQQPGNRDRGQAVQHKQRSQPQPAAQKVRSQPQAEEAKPEQAGEQRGKPGNTEEERQGRR